MTKKRGSEWLKKEGSGAVLSQSPEPKPWAYAKGQRRNSFRL